MNIAPNTTTLPILNYCEGLPERTFAEGDFLLQEGQKSNRLYILMEGGVEVRKEGALLKATTEPGTIFGEISALLDIPHMATVEVKTASRFYEVTDAAAFIDLHPELGIVLAKLLAQRLTAMSVHFSGAKLIVDQLLENESHHARISRTRTAVAAAFSVPLQRLGIQGELIDSERLFRPTLFARGTSAYSQEELQERVEERTRDLHLHMLERTRAEKNLQQQFVRINLLNQITRGISERQDFVSILRVVLRQLECNLPIDFGAVLLLDENTMSLTVAATHRC